MLCWLLLSIVCFPQDNQSTTDYVSRCRLSSGAYRSTPESGSPSLSATSAALRSLKLWSGKPEGLAETKNFVWSCYQKDSGSFADSPTAKPSYRSTAVGVMAVAALGERFRPSDLSRIQVTLLNSDQPEDLRLGAAAIETLVLDGQLNKVPGEWQSRLQRNFKKDKQLDGTYGNGPGTARTTAGYVAAFLRLGYPVAEKTRVQELLLAEQHPSGAWTNEKGEPDLEATYRVMRCLYLLRVQDATCLHRVEKFITSCRKPDGSYGLPSSSGSNSGIYFAGSIKLWLSELKK